MHHVEDSGSFSSSVMTTTLSVEPSFSTSIESWERKSTRTTCDDVISTSHVWQEPTVTSSVSQTRSAITSIPASTTAGTVGYVTASTTAPEQSHVWLGTAISTSHGTDRTAVGWIGTGTAISATHCSDGTAMSWMGTGTALPLAPIINGTCAGCWRAGLPSVLPTHLVTDDSPSPLPVSQVNKAPRIQMSLRSLAFLLYVSWAIHGHGRA